MKPKKGRSAAPTASRNTRSTAANPPKRKLASRKVAAIVPNRAEKRIRLGSVGDNGPGPIRASASPDHRVALPPSQRRLDFGDRWDYAPAPEAHGYIELKARYELFINGRFVRPKSGRYFDSINPATEEKLAEIADANARDVDLAVTSARRAYHNVWGKMPGRERGKYLYRIARLIQEKSRELAVLESMDGGKTIKESRDIDLPLVAAHFFYHAGWADKLQYAFAGRSP